MNMNIHDYDISVNTNIEDNVIKNVNNEIKRLEFYKCDFWKEKQYEWFFIINGEKHYYILQYEVLEFYSLFINANDKHTQEQLNNMKYEY